MTGSGNCEPWGGNCAQARHPTAGEDSPRDNVNTMSNEPSDERIDPALERVLGEARELLRGATPEHAPRELTRIALIDDDGAIWHGLLETLGTETHDATTARRLRIAARNDALDAEAQLRADTAHHENAPHWHGLEQELLADAQLILGQLPKTNAELRALSLLAGRHAAPDAILILGGREKYLHRGMNDILAEGFTTVRATRGARKARALVASQPRGEVTPESDLQSDIILNDRELGGPLIVCATPGAFAGAKLDLGTRALLGVLQQPQLVTEMGHLDGQDELNILDLGCGTGILAAVAARRWPTARVTASDRSLAAVTSATATARANGLDDRIHVERDLAAAKVPPASIDLVLCNPPFHDGLAVVEDLAAPMFRGAAQALRPGGLMLTVFNAHLGHRQTLQRVVGPTRQLHRDAKFIVTLSIRAERA